MDIHFSQKEKEYCNEKKHEKMLHGSELRGKTQKIY